MFCGYIKNNKIHISKELDKYEDNNILIAIDGINTNPNYLQKIKSLYTKHKNNFLEYVDDFISVLLYDKQKNISYIATDRMGTKKIYYAEKDNTLFFSNDIIKLTKTYKLEKEINIESLSMYFRYNYIPAPQTIFKNIYKLKNGTYIKYDNKNISENYYWDLIKIYNESRKNQERNFEINKSNLNKKITEFIKKEIKLSNNIGIYLSSGIDSSLVTSIIKNIGVKKVNTFTIGFECNERNEAKDSKKIAQYLKTNHKELYIKDKESINIIKKIPNYYTEPFGDASCAATLILNEFAKKNNIAVAFTGDGADQIFCGAKLYDTLYKIQKLRPIINPFNLEIKKNANKFRDYYLFKKIEKEYISQIEISYNEYRLKDVFIDNGIKKFDEEKRIKTKNIQEKRMILDLNTFMADMVCNKMNTAANKNNIQIRSPYLSKEIIEYSFKIPHKYKYHKRIKKYILKQVLYDYVPKTYYTENKKGFAIPTELWLKTYLNKELKELSTKDFLNKQNIFNYKRIQELINDIDSNPNFVWDYYMFQLWYKKYMI